MMYTAPTARSHNNRAPHEQTLPMTAASRLFEAFSIVTLIALVVVALTVPPSDSLSFIKFAYLIANILAYSSVVLARDRGGISVLIAFFFLFFVAIPAVAQIDALTFPFGASYSDQELVNAYLLFGVAQASYIAGIHIGARPKRVDREPDNVMTVRAGFAFSLSLVFLSAISIVAVGPSTLFSSREELAQNSGSSEGIETQLLFIGRSLSLLALLIVVLLFTRSPHGERKRVSFWIMLMLSAITCFALNFPPSLPRFQLLGAALALGALVIDLFRPTIKLIFTTLAILFLFFLFPALKAIGHGQGVDIRAAFENNVSNYILRVDFDAFKQVADTLIYLQSQPIRYGENFLGVLLFWVPRSAWPDKPVPSGSLVANSLGYPYTNVSSPLPAEAVLGFGPAGALIVLCAFGVFVAQLESGALHNQGSTVLVPTVVLYALVIGFSTIIMRGALNSVAPMFMTAFAAYLVLHASVRRRSRRRHNAHITQQ